MAKPLCFSAPSTPGAHAYAVVCHPARTGRRRNAISLCLTYSGRCRSDLAGVLSACRPAQRSRDLHQGELSPPFSPGIPDRLIPPLTYTYQHHSCILTFVPHHVKAHVTSRGAAIVGAIATRYTREGRDLRMAVSTAMEGVSSPVSGCPEQGMPCLSGSPARTHGHSIA